MRPGPRSRSCRLGALREAQLDPSALVIRADAGLGESPHQHETHAEGLTRGILEPGAVIGNLDHKLGAIKPRCQIKIATPVWVGVTDDIRARLGHRQRDRQLRVLVAVRNRKRRSSVTETGHLIRIGRDSLMDPWSIDGGRPLAWPVLRLTMSTTPTRAMANEPPAPTVAGPAAS